MEPVPLPYATPLTKGSETGGGSTWHGPINLKGSRRRSEGAALYPTARGRKCAETQSHPSLMHVVPGSFSPSCYVSLPAPSIRWHTPPPGAKASAAALCASQGYDWARSPILYGEIFHFCSPLVLAGCPWLCSPAQSVGRCPVPLGHRTAWISRGIPNAALRPFHSSPR